MAYWHSYAEASSHEDHSTVGTVKVLRQVWSPQLENRRDILVYLPPSYNRGDHRYPVLYMHDGQNLFDHHTSFAGEWEVDESMERLAHRGLEAIVVGIPNAGGDRCHEYGPFVDRKFGGGKGDRYLEFLVETVKPLIDRDFRTLPEREHTGLAGSSMGGLISLYAYFRYPQVFGFAGVMSPSLWFAERAIFPFIEQAPYPPGRLYLDIGTHEGHRSTFHQKFHIVARGPVDDTWRLYDLLQQKGYAPERDVRFIEEEGAAHNEAAWARRFPMLAEHFLEKK